MTKPFEMQALLRPTFPMHCPTHGQWWSKRSMQLSHMEQWEQRGGRYSIHVLQYFTLTTIPLTVTFFIGGKLRGPIWLPKQLVEMLEVSNSSSGSGGLVFRGTIPGSVPEVSNRRTTICNNLHQYVRHYLLYTI